MTGNKSGHIRLTSHPGASAPSRFKLHWGAADAAAKSAGGLKSNLQDTFTAGLSNAFLKNGALDPIKEFLQGILDKARKEPVAKSK